MLTQGLEEEPGFQGPTPLRLYFGQTVSKSCRAPRKSGALSEPLLPTDFASRHMLPLICMLILTYNF